MDKMTAKSLKFQACQESRLLGLLLQPLTIPSLLPTVTLLKTKAI